MASLLIYTSLKSRNSGSEIMFNPLPPPPFFSAWHGMPAFQTKGPPAWKAQPGRKSREARLKGHPTEKQCLHPNVGHDKMSFFLVMPSLFLALEPYSSGHFSISCKARTTPTYVRPAHLHLGGAFLVRKPMMPMEGRGAGEAEGEKLSLLSEGPEIQLQARGRGREVAKSSAPRPYLRQHP